MQEQSSVTERLREENWNLEVALQDLRTQLEEKSTENRYQVPLEQQDQEALEVTVKDLHELEPVISGVNQYAVDLDGLLRSSTQPHKRLLELLDTNGWSKESLVEWLQAESRRSTLDSSYRRNCMKCLDAVVRKYHVFPSSFFVKDVSLNGYRPQARGGFADIYKGTIGTRLVCLKLLRVYLDYDERKKKAIFTDFCKEVLIWTQLSHPNILPLIGVNGDLFEPELCLVSPWMPNDDIISFLKKNPRHDRLQSLCEIAAGLEYLHSLSPAIVHGDIKGGNVLVDENYNCVLSDFGLSKTITQTTGATTSTSSRGSVRWMAPELFGIDVASGERQYMPPRDIYAFGCTVLEIITGKPPFPDLHDGAVIYQVVNNHARPAKPINGWCPGDVWNLVTVCWHVDPSQRPSAMSVSAYLNGLKEGTQTGRAMFLLHLVNVPEKSVGIAETINLLVAMGFSRYDVREQMHRHNNDTKLVLDILTRTSRSNGDQPRVLLYTSITATTIDNRSQTYTYYQIPSGDIVEARNDGLEATQLFKTALFTPLAAITYDGGEETRIYYVDQDSILQEYCRSSNSQWYFGDLGDLKIKAAYNTSLAAICWKEDDILQVRVFYQDFDSNIIRCVGCERGPWHNVFWNNREIRILDALNGTALSAVRFCFKQDARIRIYYQDVNLNIREHRYDESSERWYHGDFETGPAPRCTPIGTKSWGGDLRVYWKNMQGEIVAVSWDATRAGGWRRLSGLVATGLQPGTNFAIASVSQTPSSSSSGVSGSDVQSWQDHSKVYFQDPDASYDITELSF